MSDLPGPEKKLDWSALLGSQAAPMTPARPVYTPARVRPRHRIAVMLHESGMRPKDIAAALGYTQARISVILNSHNEHLKQVRVGFATQVADNITDVGMRFKLYANEMLDILLKHARDPEDKANSRLSARDILYMAGFTPVKKQMNLNADLPVEELRTLVGKINEANDAAAQAARWVVSNPGEKSSAA